ncbi:uncharacterized protein EV420DRAFT_1013878 [Desarmillaria tabescens]|uniref:FAD-binding domain-containing protein n=1 Tax=Armillaria tabescens TaxID=1929756 RepID=A0AA39JJP4_ARMTA|nr:uncharacterized protein EV420DRAFT_1013878 [Desarmillaria tabescens]KAK0443903.1 hypothetical protein EV420DRAFT_1013878 [Desarmillaria tabescens]
MAEHLEREPLSGIDILIVGGGLGGLSAAIECYRKGHNVRVVERRPGLDPFGDLVAIQPSVIRTMRKWPGFVEKLLHNDFGTDLHMYKFDGTLIGVIPMGEFDAEIGERAVAVSRREAHRTLHEYATALNIPIEHGICVEDYLETADKGITILADGRRLEADVVIAADGVGGKAWSIINGKKDKAVSSGYAVYRATFPLEHALKVPELAKVFSGEGPYGAIYIGHNTHTVIGKNKTSVCVLMTYLDSDNATVNSSKTQSSDRALQHVKGWSPFVAAIFNAIPNREVIDWKLLWRDPQPNWVSPMGRITQIGDAAHSLLPSSASGATMAIEDGIALAACLNISGKNGIPLAAWVYNKLRFERVSCAQRMGLKTREKLHHTNWEIALKNPQAAFGKLVGTWLSKHDAEKYAYDNYDACAKHVLEGAPFTNTNTPPGYTYEPWTVEELLRAVREGKEIHDAGDWN